MTSAILVQRSNQLSYQANWELVICEIVGNDPLDGETSDSEYMKYLCDTGACSTQLVRALHRYRRGHGFGFRSSLNFPACSIINRLIFYLLKSYVPVFSFILFRSDKITFLLTESSKS